jgi:hypothetical protein
MSIVNSVLEIYPSSRVAAENKPLFCQHCDKKLIQVYEQVYSTAPMSDLVALLNQSRGKIVERVWPDRREWACNYCGRACDNGKRNGRGDERTNKKIVA